MSGTVTVLPPEHYVFNNLQDFAKFYQQKKDIIRTKDTRWLNRRIEISDSGIRYKITFVKGELVLKPKAEEEVLKSKKELLKIIESFTTLRDSLNLIIEKINELENDEQHNTDIDSGQIANTRPRKSISDQIRIDRIKRV